MSSQVSRTSPQLRIAEPDSILLRLHDPMDKALTVRKQIIDADTPIRRPSGSMTSGVNDKDGISTLADLPTQTPENVLRCSASGSSDFTPHALTY